MNEKYYVPTLEEFHVGFEYETYNMSCGGYVIMDFEDGDWTFETVKEPTEHMWFKDKFRLPKMPFDTVSDLKEIENRIKENRIRVKYLDEDDLIELGFENGIYKIPNYGEYIINLNNKGKIDLSFRDICDWESDWDSSIILNNKNELIKLMKTFKIQK